jgi:hypothetical protein
MKTSNVAACGAGSLSSLKISLKHRALKALIAGIAHSRAPLKSIGSGGWRRRIRNNISQRNVWRKPAGGITSSNASQRNTSISMAASAILAMAAWRGVGSQHHGVMWRKRSNLGGQ